MDLRLFQTGFVVDDSFMTASRWWPAPLVV